MPESPVLHTQPQSLEAVWQALRVKSALSILQKYTKVAGLQAES